MKYLKRFENHTNIEVGDYVICRYNSKDYYNRTFNIKKLIEFINNNIGIVVKYDNKMTTIQYHNIPDNIKYLFNLGENKNQVSVKNTIIYFGKTIEDIEVQLSANKYNL